MDMGKCTTMTIGCAEVVSVSASCGRHYIVKIVDGGLYFIFSVHFYFTLLFFFFFSFLFLEQLGLGLISHTVTSVTN